MTDTQIVTLAAAFAVVAMFYTTVGHAGASGYLAAMALVGVAPEAMRPTALTLNIVIAVFTTWRFRRARYFAPRTVGIFLLGSVPAAFLGGGIRLPSAWYKLLVGAILLCSAAYLVWRAWRRQDADTPMQHEADDRVPPMAAPFIGAAIGLLSGLTGTGGGIFLSPLILLLGWAGPKTTAGIAAPFIVVNSIAGLAGGFFKGTLDAGMLPGAILPLAAAALAGALVGTWLGLYRLPTRALIATLALVMSVAAGKLIGLA